MCTYFYLVMMECSDHTVNVKISTVRYIQLYLEHHIYIYDEAATENGTIRGASGK